MIGKDLSFNEYKQQIGLNKVCNFQDHPSAVENKDNAACTIHDVQEIICNQLKSLEEKIDNKNRDLEETIANRDRDLKNFIEEKIKSLTKSDDSLIKQNKELNKRIEDLKVMLTDKEEEVKKLQDEKRSTLRKRRTEETLEGGPSARRLKTESKSLLCGILFPHCQTMLDL